MERLAFWKKKLSVPNLLSAWLLAAALEYALLPAQSASLSALSWLSYLSLPRLVCVTVAAYAVLGCLPSDAPSARWCLPAAFALYAGLTLCRSFSESLLFSCIILAVFMAAYALLGQDSSALPAPAVKRGKLSLPLLMCIAGGIGLFVLLSVWGIARIRSFQVSSFDFGIFAQMFYYLRSTGLPLTTIERGELMSHFAVHISPIFYLLLPFYALVPRAETLPVLQAAVLASSFVPLWKLGRQHGLSEWLCAAVCLLLLLFTPFAGGVGYDMHENCFLTPLLLWLFYAFDRKSAPLTAVFAVLTCLVKEDAPVYVAVAGLYVLLRGAAQRDKRDARCGAVLLVGAGVYFCLAVWYLRAYGDGVLSDRFDNFMTDGSGSLLSILKVCLLCPMKFLYECTEPEKLSYIALTLLPLFGLPLLTRRYERLVLLIPYLLFNLASDYDYLHDIYFQYGFGSAACLIYLALVNLAELRPDARRLLALGTALCISFGCFAIMILPRVKYYAYYCITYAGEYDAKREALSVIEKDASVAASEAYTVALYDRDWLVDISYYTSTETVLECDYVVFDPTKESDFSAYATDSGSGEANFVALLLDSGYTLVSRTGETLEIYQKGA